MKKFYYLRFFVALCVFLLAIFSIWGVFYPVKIFDLQFVALLQKVFIDFSLWALILLVSLLVFTFIFGRLYCSLICPLGIFQELFTLLFRKKTKFQKNNSYKYLIFAITFGTFAAGTTFVLRHIEPYSVFGSAFTLSHWGIFLLICILILLFFKNRFFCANICPVGAILGLIAKFSLFKIYLPKDVCVSCGQCEKNCPSASINSKEKFVDNETCIKCLKCLSNCPRQGVQYGIEPKKDVTFNFERRKFLWLGATLVLFGTAAKLGATLAENIAQKLTNVILPPGAENKERFINKCLNCNLCVEVCPNKIIKKADTEYSAVKLDYSNNFCKYDCNKCAQVCPSGAIRRISLEEKQKTRIAIASINSEKCTKCRVCAFSCPVQAITYEKNSFPVIDASKCIGCGACKNACRFMAIEIFSVKEQKMI